MWTARYVEKCDDRCSGGLDGVLLVSTVVPRAMKRMRDALGSLVPVSGKSIWHDVCIARLYGALLLTSACLSLRAAE
jgi:hypothetical protein